MRYLSNKEKKDIADKVPVGYQIDKKLELKEKDDILYLGENPFLIKIEDKYLPHLKSLNEKKFASVFVDHGAIPFIMKGADLMRPGITKIDGSFNKNDIILIKDEVHNKVLACGFSLFDSEILLNKDSGKVVKIYHYVNDEFY